MTTEPPLKIVLFDAAGTLIRPSPPVGAVYAQVARQHGLTCDPHQTERAFVESFRGARAEAGERGGAVFGFDRDTAVALWRAVVEQTFARLGHSPADFEALFSQLFNEFATGRHFTLATGARETLAALRRRGLRTGLVSNWDFRLRSVLTDLGLIPLLDPILISWEAGVEKPDPAIFRLALRTAGVEAQQALMVGDSLAEDILPARSAGLRAVLLDEPGLSRHPEPSLRTLTDLPAHIDTLP